MALVVEDGTGLANADSYVSITDADTYHANHGNTTWAAASSATKEIALRSATQYVDNKYRGRWKGWRSKFNQSLAWPRAGVYDEDHYSVPSTSVPQKIADATTEAALRVVDGTDLSADLERGGSVKRTMDKVGPIETEVEYMDHASPRTVFHIIDMLVAGYISGIGASRTLRRG